MIVVSWQKPRKREEHDPDVAVSPSPWVEIPDVVLGIEVAFCSCMQLQGPAIETFVLAGNAIFTLSNPNTGGRFTYRVRASKRDPSLRLVSVLTGPDNSSDYTYLGLVNGEGRFFHGKKSTIASDAPSVKAFAWFWNHVENPAPAIVQHEGRCGRCNRKLTVPESIATGLGPECAGKVM
jgi:hypothetical protein